MDSLTLKRRVYRLLKFGVVGGSGVVVNLVVFRVMLWLLGDFVRMDAKIFAANLAGVVVSIFTNFLLNDRWTWGDRIKGAGRWWHRLGKYYLTASIAGGVQLALTSLSYEFVWQHLDLRFLRHDVSPDAALLSGIAAGMAINLAVSHLWTFKDE